VLIAVSKAVRIIFGESVRGRQRVRNSLSIRVSGQATHYCVMLHFDDIRRYEYALVTKIKNLVYVRHFTMVIPASYSTVLIALLCSFPLRFSIGTVKRSKLERLEPTISYKSFVEDLDSGDSFTTTL
jgi:hypothetical protein